MRAAGKGQRRPCFIRDVRLTMTVFFFWREVGILPGASFAVLVRCGFVWRPRPGLKMFVATRC